MTNNTTIMTNNATSAWAIGQPEGCGSASDTLHRWIHDLKSPITAVEGYTRLLLRDLSPTPSPQREADAGGGHSGSYSPDARQRRFLEGISASCRIFFLLLGNLKLERELEGDHIPQPTEFGELDKILDHAGKEFTRAFDAKNSKVLVLSPSWTIRHGAEVVEAVAGNLLLTALHTSAEGADVILEGKLSDGELTLTLSAAEASVGGPGRAFELSARLAEKLGGRSRVDAGRLSITLPESVFA